MMKTKELIFPSLNTGDTIGIAAPAGRITDHSRFEAGLHILHRMGFEVKYPRDLWPGSGYLSDSDENRGEELNRLFADPEVKAILALRGGYGCLRMLNRIDCKQIRRTPKPFLGFSDITLLHSYLYSQTGLVTFHGPVLTSLVDCTQESLERFYYCLKGSWNRNITPKNLEILRGGDEVSGSLTGGNLSTLMTTLGTPFEFNWHDKIVVLEDTNEPLYRLDRMLTQLYYCGKFEGVRAILLGDFSLPNHVDTLEKLRHHETIWHRVLKLTDNQKTTIWGNFPIGHCPRNLTLPLGAQVRIDNSRAKVSFS